MGITDSQTYEVFGDIVTNEAMALSAAMLIEADGEPDGPVCYCGSTRVSECEPEDEAETYCHDCGRIGFGGAS